MNWIKQNQFLTGFFAIMVVGVGVLGYLFFSAMSAAEEATNTYNTTASTLTNLQSQNIARTQQSLTALTKQRDEAVQATKDFQGLLSKWSFPFEDMTPEQFQDRLRKSRTALLEKGGVATVFPKEKFYVGFDEYETQPPIKEAVPALGRELKAIEWLCTALIDAKVAEVTAIKRTPIAEETGKTAAPQRPGGNQPRSGGGGGGGGGGERRQKLMVANSVDLEIHCSQAALGRFLNSLVDPKVPQFYVLRSVSIKNDQPQGPSRTPPQTADSGNPEGIKKGNYILGEELVTAALRLDIVDFAEPAAPATPAPK